MAWQHMKILQGRDWLTTNCNFVDGTGSAHKHNFNLKNSIHLNVYTPDSDLLQYKSYLGRIVLVDYWTSCTASLQVFTMLSDTSREI